MFEVGQEVKVNQIDSGNGVVDADGERGVITHVGSIEDGRALVYVEWVERPLRHQAGGDMRDERKVAILALGIILVALGMAGQGDLVESETDATNYCEMVEIHKRTGGGNGWPDYRGIAAEVCER